ncbi:membrane hypothetical protein [Candidatus Sulfopaludibacter sp. SbA3]|nr:membrane hypothetical protein [Candidatus Sulfopaludibacter sp. SbA3]
MESNSQNAPDCSDGADWPAKPIFTWGTLGGPAGRRYHTHCAIALTTMVICMISAGFAGLKLIAGLVPGVAFGYIAWEFRKYLSELDELARRIHLESIAWTYLTGLAVAMLLGGISLIYGWRLNLIWFVVLEPVRSIWLYSVSRRYR